MTNFITRFRGYDAFLEILGDSKDPSEYNVEFVDLNTNKVEYSTTIRINHWSEVPSNIEKNWLIKVTCNDEVVFERRRDFKYNAVFIKFTSASLGDTIAWIPYAEEYRKTHNVKVYLSTYHNYLFDKVYPDLIFLDKDKSFNDVNDVDKKFKIDYYPLNFAGEDMKKYDNNIVDYRKISIQSVASTILGLPNDEIVPKVNINENTKSKIHGKYVVVAIQSTAQLKYWNNPFGWERLFDFLSRNGYKIVLIDKYKKYGVIGNFNQVPKSKNLIDKTGNFSLSERIIDIKHADMMITISSGLAWLSWAVGTPVVMISGFTKPWNEFQSNCVRVHNSTVCNGCWNDTNILFDNSNWLFCPKKMDFICSKIIQPKDVIDSVKKLMK